MISNVGSGNSEAAKYDELTRGRIQSYPSKHDTTTDEHDLMLMTRELKVRGHPSDEQNYSENESCWQHPVDIKHFSDKRLNDESVLYETLEVSGVTNLQLKSSSHQFCAEEMQENLTADGSYFTSTHRKEYPAIESVVSSDPSGNSSTAEKKTPVSPKQPEKLTTGDISKINTSVDFGSCYSLDSTVNEEEVRLGLTARKRSKTRNINHSDETTHFVSEIDDTCKTPYKNAGEGSFWIDQNAIRAVCSYASITPDQLYSREDLQEWIEQTKQNSSVLHDAYGLSFDSGVGKNSRCLVHVRPHSCKSSNKSRSKVEQTGTCISACSNELRKGGIDEEGSSQPTHGDTHNAIDNSSRCKTNIAFLCDKGEHTISNNLRNQTPASMNRGIHSWCKVALRLENSEGSDSASDEDIAVEHMIENQYRMQKNNRNVSKREMNTRFLHAFNTENEDNTTIIQLINPATTETDQQKIVADYETHHLNTTMERSSHASKNRSTNKLLLEYPTENSEPGDLLMTNDDRYHSNAQNKPMFYESSESMGTTELLPAGKSVNSGLDSNFNTFTFMDTLNSSRKITQVTTDCTKAMSTYLTLSPVIEVSLNQSLHKVGQHENGKCRFPMMECCVCRNTHTSLDVRDKAINSYVVASVAMSLNIAKEICSCMYAHNHVLHLPPSRVHKEISYAAETATKNMQDIRCGLVSKTVHIWENAVSNSQKLHSSEMEFPAIRHEKLQRRQCDTLTKVTNTGDNEVTCTTANDNNSIRRRSASSSKVRHISQSSSLAEDWISSISGRTGTSKVHETQKLRKKVTSNSESVESWSRQEISSVRSSKSLSFKSELSDIISGIRKKVDQNEKQWRKSVAEYSFSGTNIRKYRVEKANTQENPSSLLQLTIRPPIVDNNDNEEDDSRKSDTTYKASISSQKKHGKLQKKESDYSTTTMSESEVYSVQRKAATTVQDKELHAPPETTGEQPSCQFLADIAKKKHSKPTGSIRYSKQTHREVDNANGSSSAVNLLHEKRSPCRADNGIEIYNVCLNKKSISDSGINIQELFPHHEAPEMAAKLVFIQKVSLPEIKATTMATASQVALQSTASLGKNRHIWLLSTEIPLVLVCCHHCIVRNEELQLQYIVYIHDSATLSSEMISCADEEDFAITKKQGKVGTNLKSPMTETTCKKSPLFYEECTESLNWSTRNTRVLSEYSLSTENYPNADNSNSKLSITQDIHVNQQFYKPDKTDSGEMYMYCVRLAPVDNDRSLPETHQVLRMDKDCCKDAVFSEEVQVDGITINNNSFNTPRAGIRGRLQSYSEWCENITKDEENSTNTANDNACMYRQGHSNLTARIDQPYTHGTVVSDSVIGEQKLQEVLDSDNNKSNNPKATDCYERTRATLRQWSPVPLRIQSSSEDLITMEGQTETPKRKVQNELIVLKKREHMEVLRNHLRQVRCCSESDAASEATRLTSSSMDSSASGTPNSSEIHRKKLFTQAIKHNKSNSSCNIKQHFTEQNLIPRNAMCTCTCMCRRSHVTDSKHSELQYIERKLINNVADPYSKKWMQECKRRARLLTEKFSLVCKKRKIANKNYQES